jgi:acylglycerol lipase
VRKFVACILLLLAACAPDFGPSVSGSVAPVVTDDAIVARDGVRLPLRRWEADGKPRAVIVALHGMSDYSNAFDMPGRYWARLGITTLAYDQRGFGKSEHPGIWAGAGVMRADLEDAVAAAHARYPGVPVFAMGESMGGAVVLTALECADAPADAPKSCADAPADAPKFRADAPADAPKLDVSGVILVAPAVWSRSDMPLSYRAALFLGAHLLPGMILSNSAASHVVTIVPSDNVPMLRALGRDPLFQKQTRTDTVYGLVNLMDEGRSAPDAIAHAPPLLFLYGANDQIIPAMPTQAVIAALKTKPGVPLTVKRYEHGYHMLLRDLEGETVDQDVADWIFAQQKNS